MPEAHKGLGPVLIVKHDEVLEIDGTHPAVRTTSFGYSSLRLKIKRLTRAQQAKLQAKHTTTSKGRTPRLEAMEFAEDVFRTCLVGWNMRKSATEELPFTPENIDLVIEHCSELVNIVFSVATESSYVEAEDADTEEALKGN